MPKYMVKYGQNKHITGSVIIVASDEVSAKEKVMRGEGEYFEEDEVYEPATFYEVTWKCLDPAKKKKGKLLPNEVEP